MNRTLSGHLSALVCIVIWGSTFIATKILLSRFSAVAIILIRFTVGFLALLALRPRRLRLPDRKREGVFALAGLTGVTLYFLLENTALTYTMAANVGIIIAAAPLFTGLLAVLLSRGRERLSPSFLLGFTLAIAGISLVSLNGARLHMNPFGDLLVLGAAVSWAVYSLLLRKIDAWGYDPLLVTRRVFFWGLVFMLPASLLLRPSADLSALPQPRTILLFAYLGVCACALCYVLWGRAVSILGPVRTGVWLYLSPVVTMIFSSLILKEPVTLLSLSGAGLVLLGLFFSER